MKKIIVAIIILILAAGATLYFGWVSVEPGYFGIAHSTIKGTIEYPLESGKFYWLWEKLIPGTFHLYKIQKKPERIKIEITQPLPGSEQIQKFGNFYIGVTASIDFTIDFEVAKILIKDGLLDKFKENLTDQLSSKLKEPLSNFILTQITPLSKGDMAIDSNKLERLKDELGKTIVETAKSNKLQSISYTISYSHLPNPEVYTRAVEHYRSYIDTAYAMEQEVLRREFEDRRRIAEHDIEMDRLNKYAELISKYPDMLKFFYIEKLGGEIDVLVLPENEITGFPRFLEYGYKPFQIKPEARPAEPEEKEVEPLKPSSLPESKKVEPLKPSPLLESEKVEERKWYEKLMFWKNPGKEKKER
jgi:hypothetical protein